MVSLSEAGLGSCRHVPWSNYPRMNHPSSVNLMTTKYFPAWDVASLLVATGGHLLGGQYDPVLGAVCTDSRSVEKGDIFVALKGERFDGHEFLVEARERGAAALVVCHDFQPMPRMPVILVEDTLQALGDMAAFRRLSLPSLQVLAITGSSGKTTVKDMVAAIIGRQYQVIKTAGNRNNLIGLPLSLLPVNISHDLAVLEMGMNQPGEIARLTEIADPDIACITNVQKAHLEGLGNIDGVAGAKGELFNGVNDLAVLIVNLDDPKICALAAPLKNRKIFFGLASRADVRATHIRSLGEKGMAYTLHLGGEKRRVLSHYAGVHNVQNSLAAAALAVAAGVEIDSIAEGLSEVATAAGRLEILETVEGIKIINDTYNANPGSMGAALAVLRDLAGHKRKIAVLGDMLELGRESSTAHRALGREVVKKNCDVLYAVGRYARKIIEGAREAGLEKQQARELPDNQAVIELLKKLLVLGDISRGDWILVKGSRAMGMEAVVTGLAGPFGKVKVNNVGE